MEVLTRHIPLELGDFVIAADGLAIIDGEGKLF